VELEIETLRRRRQTVLISELDGVIDAQAKLLSLGHDDLEELKIAQLALLHRLRQRCGY